MKQFVVQVFVTLGVIFLIVIVLAAYFFVTDPYNLKPLIFGTSPATYQSTNGGPTDGSTDSVTEGTGSATEAGGGFQLTESQRQALMSLGIDPATVPSTITVEQEACFTTALGEARVAEIKAGAVPNAIEFFKAKSCI